MTETELEETLSRIAERVTTPVIVDADTGFGNALNVQRTVKRLERAGAAAIQLEDQNLDGTQLVGAAEMTGPVSTSTSCSGCSAPPTCLRSASVTTIQARDVSTIMPGHPPTP